jgi:hypothetical protein
MPPVGVRGQADRCWPLRLTSRDAFSASTTRPVTAWPQTKCVKTDYPPRLMRPQSLLLRADKVIE